MLSISKLKILLVEDVESDAVLVEHELRRARLDIDLRRVETSGDFLREITEWRPDIILADYSLPQFTALDALQLLKEQQSDVPLVLVTGSTSEEIAVQCIQDGAEDYILKSSLKRLPAAVQRSLKKHLAEGNRRETEQALRRSEEQYRLITENTRDLICLLDLDFNFLYASPSYELVLGRPVKDLIGTRCADLVHHDDARLLKETFDEALFFREGRNVELRFRHANDSWATFESAASVIFDEMGKPQRALLVSRDTSDRKRAEKEIRKLAAFPRFNPNPVLEFTADGSLTYFNDAALEMARSLKKNHPQSILPLNTATIVKMCLSTGQNKLRLDTNINGRILSWSFFPVMANQVVHCYAEDVTDRLNLEAQLRQAQKMESVGQLAAGVAHDFNNILTIIQGHAGLLSSDPKLDADLGESTRQIAVAAERAANLTRQLLMFSRKQLMQPQLLNLNDVINNVSTMLQALSGAQVTLHRQTSDDLPPICADAGMMEQILVNLSVNARDAMPRGGTLRINTQFAQIDQEYADRHPESRMGNFICLSVGDSGHGMDSSTLNRIFEPFFTTKEIGKGTGLGLATVYGIVKQHHGWVEVESQVGQGTTFKVFLPIATKAAPTNLGLKPKDVPGGDETILVVEDEPALRELVQEILEKKGYRVLEASTGVQALKLWEQHKHDIDLLLTDIMMPEGISGRELAERVLLDRANLKIIYSSGYSLDAVNTGSAMTEGMNFLQKPYDPETLAQMVRNCLNN
jgi:two-component system, cell cycle sensor histidine kinase and response regulator CckA